MNYCKTALRGFVSLGSLAAACAPGIAFAQDQAAEVAEPAPGEIIVTAQKREERLQDVPIAITALTQTALEQKGINTLQDFVRVPPPGLAIQAFAGAPQSIVVDIRGISNPDPTQGTTELGVAVYLDDVYLGRAQGLGMDLADPERIEVLRGPQGTLFGRNAEGGAVRIVTAKPTGEFGGRVRVGFGNYGQERYEAHINLPEVAGFAVKIDYLKTGLDGYTRNGTARVPALGQQGNFGQSDSEGWRASVRWRPVETLTIDYSYDDARSEDFADWWVLQFPNPFPAGFNPGAVPLDRTQPAGERVNRRTDVVTARFNPASVTETSGHTLTAAYDVSDSITIKSISGWRKVDALGTNNLGGSFTTIPFELTPGLGIPLPAGAFVPDPTYGSLGTISPGTLTYGASGVVPLGRLRQSQFSQELQLIGSTDTLEYVFGAYYYTERVSDLRQTFFSALFTDPVAGGFTSVVHTNPFLLPFPGQGPGLQTARSRSFAAFSQATWTPEFADGRLHLTGGLRYTNDRKDAVRTQAGGVVLATPIEREFRESRVDPTITVAYDVTPDVNLFARFAQAYRAGGAGIRDPQFRSFDEEVNTAYELGLKSTLLDRKLILNLAAFYNDVKGRQLTVQVDPNNPAITATINAPGKSPVYGFEAEVTLNPAPGLTIGAVYAYQKGKFSAESRAALAVIDPGGSFFIPNLPEHSGTFTVDYITPDLGFGKLAFHGDYAWANEHASTVRVPANNFAWPLERDLANARVSLQDLPIGPTGLTIAGYVRNIFDTAYPVFTAPSSNAVLSAPRTYGIEAILRF